MPRVPWTLPLLLLALSCGDEQAVPAAPAAAPFAPVEVAKAVDDAPEAPKSEEYTYNPIGKRDPFRTFIASQESSKIPAPTPLQRFDIDQYSLVGIVWGTDRPRGMVEDPEMVGHVVEIGTYIGKNWGKVTQITSDKIVVTEEYLTVDGTLVVNPIEIVLPVPE